MFKTHVNAWFWGSILKLDFDAWFWCSILPLDFDAWFWHLILTLDFDAWFWRLILMLDFDTWFWRMILTLDFDVWGHLIKDAFKLKLQMDKPMDGQTNGWTNKRTDNANPRFALWLKMFPSKEIFYVWKFFNPFFNPSPTFGTFSLDMDFFFRRHP